MAGHWHILWTSVFWALMAAGAAASIPILLGDAVDEGLISRQWHRFAVYVALIATLGIVQGLSSGARRWYNGVASRHVESELRRGFHDHLLTLDVAYHSNVNRGQLLSRVTSDLFQIQAVVASAPFWVANAALAVAVAIILLVTSPLLGVVAVVALPLVAITSQRFSRRVREAIADLQRKRGALAGVVEETISGIRAVKGFGAEPIMERRLATSADEVRVEAMRVVTTRARYLPTLNTVPMLELAAVNWLGGYLVIHHELSVGMLVAFNAYLAMLTGPLQSIGAYIVMIQRAVVSGYRLDTIMSRQSTVAEPAHPAPLPPGPGTVRFSDVSLLLPGCRPHPARRPAPRSTVSTWRSTGGEVVAMVGATGSGKTTVLSLLARLYDTGSGSVTLEGVDVRDLGLSNLRRSGGGRVRRQFPFQRHHRRQPAGGAGLGHRRGASRGGPPGPGRRVHRRLTARLPNGGRRARPLALGRAAPAHRPGPGVVGRPARSSSSTTPPRPSTPPGSCRWCGRWPKPGRARRRSLFPTGRPPSPPPTGSSWWTRAGCWRRAATTSCALESARYREVLGLEDLGNRGREVPGMSWASRRRGRAGPCYAEAAPGFLKPDRRNRSALTGAA